MKKLRTAGSDASSLGLAIGFEYGPINVTRLGIKGGLIRCSASRAVLRSEDEQTDCSGVEIAIGPEAYLRGSQAVRDLFGTTRKRADLEYATGVDDLNKRNEKAEWAELFESSKARASQHVAAHSAAKEEIDHILCQAFGLDAADQQTNALGLNESRCVGVYLN